MPDYKITIILANDEEIEYTRSGTDITFGDALSTLTVSQNTLIHKVLTQWLPLIEGAGFKKLEIEED